ncbi:hypothetical protein C2R22_14595 [Salinigranum rubrum]|uniref:Uncharacterized protein n=1 Tax=Salinigranum rubrum TaxID=755307 RepID=A0A2I8VLC6_9EURY|nr:hypothetical protein [Salinigranum rubrum]AUV82721.1 hypothetical protein C2R22_14595 [Salinigranum rubrum]
MSSDLRCRLCGAELRTGLVASGRRACCLNDTPIVGACPNHGPLGPHHASDADSTRAERPNDGDPSDD